MGLERCADVVECCRDEDDAPAGGGVSAVVWVQGGGLEEVGKGGFEGVKGADYVDVDYGFESVGGEAGERGEEVACCAGAEDC